MTKPKNHNISVWARDLRRTQWAWSCTCGTRYHEDLTSREAAAHEAHTHAAQRPTADTA